MVEGFTKSTPANKLYIMYLLTHVVVMVCQKYMYVIVIPCTGYLSTCTMHASIKQQHQSKQTPPPSCSYKEALQLKGNAYRLSKLDHM